MAAEDAKFKLPDISTLAGASLWIYLRAIVGRKVHPRYYLKIFITFLIILLSLPFRLYENLKFYLPLRRFQMKKPPIFIIGHWRSGTTHLHNVLCKDPQAAYLTTYMSLFPEALGTKVIFKNFMRWVMPKKRPSDNVKLAVDFPQEDEFALGNIHPYCYYYFFHFPFDYQEYYQDYVLFKGKEKIKKSWKKTYKHLISKSIMNTQGERAIFKNPVNTARIPALLELFPQARFIYIFRNPIIVYLSTKKFFVELFPTLQFQQVSEEEISDLILDVYQKLMHDYLRFKSQIPDGQLIEIRFEDFEKDNLGTLDNIYQTLTIDGFEQAKPHFENYIAAQKSYKKNTYKISQEELNKILEKWGFALEDLGYQVPENLEVLPQE